MKLPQQKQSNLICARYAFKPNNLKYCGPDQNRELLEYLKANESDEGLENILKKFETLFPYLKLISTENKIKNPFDSQIIDAYWIGNDLLKNIKKVRLYEHLTEQLSLKKKLPASELDKLTKKFTNEVNSHHSFHVFNIWKRTGYIENPHTLFTMDECKISWGQVLDIQNKIMEVSYEPLIFKDKKLALGPKKERKIIYELPSDIKKGDWVSFHWSSYCNILSLNELQRLKYWTSFSIKIYNDSADQN